MKSSTSVPGRVVTLAVVVLMASFAAAPASAARPARERTCTSRRRTTGASGRSPS